MTSGSHNSGLMTSRSHTPGVQSKNIWAIFARCWAKNSQKGRVWVWYWHMFRDRNVIWSIDPVVLWGSSMFCCNLVTCRCLDQKRHRPPHLSQTTYNIWKVVQVLPFFVEGSGRTPRCHIVQFPAIHFPSSKNNPLENEHIQHILWKLMTWKMKSPNGPFSGMVIFGGVTLQVVETSHIHLHGTGSKGFVPMFLDQSTRLPVVLVRIPKFSSSFSWARNYIIPIARSVHHFRLHTVDASKFPVLLLGYNGYMYR